MEVSKQHEVTLHGRAWKNVHRERDGETHPFFKLVIAPSRSFSRWSRTLVELAKIRTREADGKSHAKADRTRRGDVNVGSFGS